MKKRIVYFDYFRVIATIGVVFGHVSGQFMWAVDGRSFDWYIFNFYQVALRWVVLAFVMISGSLFLSKDIEIKSLYKKSILRLVVSYFAWSIFYALATPIVQGIFSGEFNLAFDTVLSASITGYYHMWYIPMILGVYMCVPAFREIVRNKAVAKYFLLITFIFAFLFPELVALANDFTDGLFLSIVNSLDTVISDTMYIFTVFIYIAYFILGYLLEEAELSKKQRNIIYALGIAGFLCSYGLDAIVSWKTGEPCGYYHEPYCVNMLLEVIAVHTWFKYGDYKNEKLNRIIASLSKYSFGAFLIHAFVLDFFHSLGLNALTWNSMISIPVVSLLVAALSFGISWVIHKIPVLNKWIV